MTSLQPSHLIGASPSRPSNPFAKPRLAHSPTSFSRTSLLPSLASPAKSRNDFGTPSNKPTSVPDTASSQKGRSGWRLLWRGGLEVGDEGYRMDGVTFYAQIAFPGTPSNVAINPFDVNTTPQSGSNIGGTAVSPFDALRGADTDLCLSFESMRGRKCLKLRGVVDLPAEEVIDGADEAGVQMSISPTAPLLAGYFTSLLCRHATLSPSGRTLSAIAIGLGDDLHSQNSTVLVYGQRSDEDPTSLRLLVGKRRPPPPPPSERKVRPGEPLPRAPLFFPSTSATGTKGPFRRNVRSLSRAPSVSSIYAPPPPPVVAAPSTSYAPVSGRTPGRRGEKRPRQKGEESTDGDDKKRSRAGKIIVDKKDVRETGHGDIQETADEDIFGKRGSSIGPSGTGEKIEQGENRSAKRSKVPQQVLDNKGVIRKQTMVMMEERGCGRTHPEFKDVFGMTTKGVYFAFRNHLEVGPITKEDVKGSVNGHLDMYLPVLRGDKNGLSQVVEEDEEELNERDLFAQTVEGASEPITSEGAMSEVPTSGGLSDEPVSVGMISEGGMSEEEPYTERLYHRDHGGPNDQAVDRGIEM